MSASVSDVVLPYVYAATVGAAATFLPLVATCLTGIRLYVRRKTDQGFGADDWCVVAAIVFLWGLTIVTLFGISRRILGYPSPPPADPADYSQFEDDLNGQVLLQKIQYGFWSIAALTFGCVKVAILLFYRRFFVVSHTKTSKVNVLLWVGIAFSVVWTLAFFLLEILDCGVTPSYYWDPYATALQKCLPGIDILAGMAASDTFTDVLIFIIPFPLVWKLKLSQRKKWEVSLIFLLGSASLVASAFRLYLHIAFLGPGYATRVDLFLTITLVMYLTLVEAGIALIAVNLPTFGKLFGLRSVQSVVGSVRSPLSLRSMESFKNKSTKDLSGREAPSQEQERPGKKQSTKHKAAISESEEEV